MQIKGVRSRSSRSFQYKKELKKVPYLTPRERSVRNEAVVGIVYARRPQLKRIESDMALMMD